MPSIAREFTARCVHHMRDEHLPRIEAAVERLGPDDLWWRPNEASNSAGNLLLHLEGNVRQWILSGLGNEPDRRTRSSEFAGSDGEDGQTLCARLRRTVEEAAAVVEGLDEAALLQPHDVQVFSDISGLAMVLHVVEHFGWHAGQITAIAKQRSGRGMDFYVDEELE
jgi:uncharacterized damage-inducible protein DinB